MERRPIVAVLALAAAQACSDGRADPPKPLASAQSASGNAPRPGNVPSSKVVTSFFRDLPKCDISYRGLSFDAGTESLSTRYGWSGTVPGGITSVEHDGSTWARVSDRKLSFVFTLLERTQLFVSARVVGYGARGAQVSLDDQAVGSLSFAHEQIRVATTATTSQVVDPGLHTLTIRFVGRARDGDAFADIDWVRIGVPEEGPQPTYGAPTMKDLVVPSAALSGVPHRSLAMRAPGGVRCSTRLSKRARVRVAVGFQGEGAGDAEIRVLRDGEPPQTIETIHVEGGAGAKWTIVDKPLGHLGSGVASLEIAATETSRTGRLLFGDPEVIVDTAGTAKSTPPARAVVLVVLGSAERGELPPWSGGSAPTLPTLTDLSLAATTFDRHRAPSTVVAASMASLLTGTTPGAHALTDASARLPASQTTLATVARDASVRTAMFTGVPFTFRAFGFAAPWERYADVSPTSGEPATAPLDMAAQWVQEVSKGPEGTRLFAVVHARGAHPPWDVTAKELGTVPPKDYTGMLEPRRAAQTIAKMRRRRARDTMTDADRLRLRSLEALGLSGQDRALGNLIAALKSANLWDSTLFVVTGDVGSGRSDGALFADGLDLQESLLALPLYVHFPNGLFGGKRITEPTEAFDVTKTALAALGLGFAKPRLGRDLAEVASGVSEGLGEPQVALLGDRYAARWGDLVLHGRFGKPPDLCDLGRDAMCAFNRRETMPLAARAIFERLIGIDGAVRTAIERREPATMDAETQAALNVWGAVND